MHNYPAATCVFCGRVIGPDEPTSGRPPMAAHAACADAALADDRHWDAVADASPDAAATSEAGRPEAKRRSAGCLAVAATALAALLLPPLLLVAA